MKPLDTILLAQSEGASLYLRDDILKCKPGEFPLSKELINAIKSNKEELIDLLKATNSQSLKSLVAVDKDEFSSVSFFQERTYIEHFIHPKGALTIPLNFTVNLAIDDEDFIKAVRYIELKHPSLTQGFTESAGGIKSVSIDNGIPINILSAPSASHEDCTKFLEQEKRYHFDLLNDAKLRMGLIKLSDGNSIISMVAHHIAVDGDSFSIILNDLLMHITDNTDTPASDYNYKDFAHNQRNDVNACKLSHKFWEKELLGAPNTHSLPKSYVAISEDKNKVIEHQLDNIQSLKNFCVQHKVTPFAILHGLWSIVSAISGNAEEVVIGTPVSCRLTNEDFNVVGPYLNTLPLRAVINKDKSLCNFLLNHATKVGNALEHQQYPFEKIIEASKQSRNVSYTPLFQLLYTHRNKIKQPNTINGIEVKINTNKDIHRSFDIELSTEENEKGLLISLSYNTAMFSDELIDSMLNSYTYLIKNVQSFSSTNINNLKLSSEDYRLFGRCVDLTNELSVNEAIEKADKGLLAVTATGSKGITYGDLSQNVTNLSNYIRENMKGEFIGVMTERNSELVTILLAIWKAGKAYLPLDPSYPVDRLQYMIDDANVTDVIVSEIDNKFKIDRVHVYDQLSLANSLAPSKKACTAYGENAYMIYTSGTTGNPKGVVVPHSAVKNFLYSMQDLFKLDKNDSLLAITPISFDISVLELFLPLLVEGTVVVSTSAESKNPLSILSMINTHNISMMQATPSTWKGIKNHGNLKSPLKMKALSGGEPLLSDLANWMCEHFQDVWNMYGPTETTVWSTAHKISKDKSIHIGKPILNTDIKIISSAGITLLPGMLGELAIGGSGLSKGYFGKCDLTKERFIAIDDKPYYKTGDMAYIDKVGNIHCLGRQDEQVKVNGHRIELGEIDTVAKSVRDVSDVVSNIYTSDNVTKIATYVVCTNDSDKINILESLKVAFRKSLPSHMLPSEIIFIMEIPQTPNGKVDKKNLPDPNKEVDVPLKDALIKSNNNTILAVRNIFKSLVEQSISDQDELFSSGGNSLTAIRIVNAINKHLDIDLSLTDLFKYPTIYDLAQFIDSTTMGPVEKLTVVEESSDYPVSSAQARIAAAEFLNNSNTSLILRNAYEVPFIPNKDKLTSVINEHVSAHEILRTTYSQDPTNGEFRQVVHEKLEPEIIFSEVHNSYEDAWNWLNKLAERKFNLEKDSVIRVHVALYQNQAIIDLVIHHVASDAWSSEKLLTSILNAYNNDIKLNKLEFSYKDYAVWEKNELSKKADSLSKYWKKALNGFPAYPQAPNFGVKQGFQGKGFRARAVLGKVAIDSLNRIKENSNLTNFGVLFSAYSLFVSALSNNERTAIATPISNRNLSEAEHIQGCFVNNLVLTNELDMDDSPNVFLEKIQQMLVSAWDNSLLPFQEVLHLNNIVHSKISPYFTYAFSANTHNQESEESLNSINIEKVGTQTALKLHIDELPNKLILLWEIDDSAFKKSDIKYISELFERFLIAIADSNKTVSDIFDNAYLGMDTKNMKEPRTLPNLTLTDMFNSSLRSNPDKIAIVCDKFSYTYQELFYKANKLANYLVKTKKVSKGDYLGTLLDRDSNMIVASLAIILAGAVHLPIDKQQTTDKKRYILEHAKPKFLITDTHIQFDTKTSIVNLENALSKSEELTFEKVESSITPKDPAFLLFTSGTTGNSKGVILSHEGVAFTLNSEINAILNNESARILHYASASFDAYTDEWVKTLLSGNTLCIASEEQRTDFKKLSEFINKHKVSLVGMTPTALLNLSPKQCPEITKVITFGESALPELIKEWDGHAEFFNAYGPTEGSICTSVEPLKYNEQVTIGTPFNGIGYDIISKSGVSCPKFITGELIIFGDTLAIDYLQGTATARLSSFNRQERCYRTGDNALFRSDGKISYRGRGGDEVKVKGQRVSLSALRDKITSKSEGGANIILFDEHSKSFRVFIYPNNEIEIDRISSLPELSELPFSIEGINEIPKTINGKVNYEALRASKNTCKQLELPKSENEKLIYQLWKELLKKDDIGIEDNFYHLGGNSILLTKLMYACEEHLGTQVSMKELVNNLTIKKQAVLLQEKVSELAQDNDSKSEEDDEFFL